MMCKSRCSGQQGLESAHFTDEKTGVQRCEAICPQSHCEAVVEQKSGCDDEINVDKALNA